MIYDCFLFFNEFEVLELRLAELQSAVDQFVLVEGAKTFSGEEKPLHFAQNRERFAKYLNKIRHVIVEEMPPNSHSAWDVEAYQRNAILRGLEEAAPNDLIVISDVDEIPRATVLSSFSGHLAALELDSFYYTLNCKNLAAKWVGPVLVKREILTSPEQIRMRGRRYWDENIPVIANAGWHFSFLQNPEGIRQKIEAFAHQEYNNPVFTTLEQLRERTQFGLDIFGRRDHYWCVVPIDESFPRYLRENPRRFRDLVSDFGSFHMGRQDLIYSLQGGLADTPALLIKREVELEQANAQVQQITSLWAKSTSRRRRFLGLLTMPIDWFAGAALILTEALGRISRSKPLQGAPCEQVKDPTRCSVIIVSWEGKDLLAESLPALLEAIKFHGGDHEIIVVDNGSTDGTQAFLQKQFPQVRVIRSEENLYFGGGNNLGINEAKNDILVLLNNDMIVDEEFLAPLLEPFHRPDTFAVASQVSLADADARPEETGKTRASFNGTELDWRHEVVLPNDEREQYVPVFWGHGGAVAVDRKKLLWQGGFDPLFDPFYVEDADISYGAWKVGWRCLLAVSSRVIHKHRSSTRRFGAQFISQIVRRNQYLFFWKNFTDIDKLSANALGTFRARIRRMGMPGIGMRVEIKALLGAVKRLPQVISRRLQRARYITRTDESILQLIGAASDDLIQSSQIEFRYGAFEEQLGEGWHELEGANRESFRWMKARGSVFLHAPSGGARLVVTGFVPALSSYKVRPVILTLWCFGHQKHFPLKEGRLVIEWDVSPLPAGFPVEVRLTVNQTVESSGDCRIRSLIVDSIGFAQTGRRRDSGILLPQRLALGSERKSESRMAGRSILMVCPYLPTRGGHGGANMMFNLIRSLSKRHRLTVLAFYENEVELQCVPELSKYCETLEVIYRGQTFEEGNLFGVKPPDILREFHHPRMAGLVKRHLSAKQFDILHCEFLYTGHLAALAPNIPAVLTNHEVLSLSYENNYRRLRWPERGKLKALVAWMRILNYEEKVLARMSAAVVLTRPEAEFLQRLVPRVHVYARAMGVDCEYFSPQAQVDTKTVVFVGNFRHSPNVSAALWLLREIWPRVHRELPDARLMIVGGEPDVRMKEFDGKDNVTLTGRVPDVRPYLNEASVVVAPVFEGAGMRTKVLEAWAMQKPVVGTGLSFEGLTTQSGDLGYIADRADSFADNIELLLKDPELARSMGQRARRFVEEGFSWEALADTYDQIYKDVSEKRNPHGHGNEENAPTGVIAGAKELQEQR